MRLLNPLRPHLADIDAYAQSLKLWVLELVAWVAALLDSRAGRIEVQKMMMTARSDLRALIFLKMVARLRLLQRSGARSAPVRPNAAPPGFRYAWRSLPAMKVLTRGIRLKTLADLKRVLDHMDDVVDRALARRPRTVTRWALVAVAPVAQRLPSCAFTHTPDGADTS